MTARALFTVFTILLIASPAMAEIDLAEALLEMEDGRVLLRFETADDVWGRGSSIRVGEPGSRRHEVKVRNRDDYDNWDDDEGWEQGPMQMLMKFRDGELRDVSARIGTKPPRYRENLLDLGLVDPQEAADALLRLAREGEGSALDEIFFPVSVARGVEIWPELLEIARSRRLDEDLRESAVFWLGQAAGEAATEGLIKLLEDDDEELEIREHAIFSLSQRDSDECVPALHKIATSSAHPQLREQALFWLSQHDDPRVLALFEEILLGN